MNPMRMNAGWYESYAYDWRAGKNPMRMISMWNANVKV